MTDDITAAFRHGTLAPSQALALLKHLDWGVAAASIKRRLESGLIAAKAEEIVSWRGTKEVARQRLADIPASQWLTVQIEHMIGFWQSGEIVFYDRASPHSYVPDIEHEAFSVRFNEADVRRLLPDSPGPRSEDREESSGAPRPPVSQADLNLWARVAIGVYGDRLTEGLALRSAKAMFPDNAVSRDKVRALLPPRKPGRPASGDKSRD